ncbi:MAG: hypothetical protein PHY73_07505 [Candidatus Omnitrophica bacterium]|nr:hypothetical protein [Candidatus Omnitrophota bacterium]
MKKPHDAYEDKIFAVMGYLWILCIIPLVFKKDNQFVLAHSKQGLVIFVGIVCLFVASILFDWILRPGLFVSGILSVWGIIESIKGKNLKIPFIHQIADKIIL